MLSRWVPIFSMLKSKLFDHCWLLQAMSSHSNHHCLVGGTLLPVPTNMPVISTNDPRLWRNKKLIETSRTQWTFEWRFPEIGQFPSSHPCYRWIFKKTNHPFVDGTPPFFLILHEFRHTQKPYSWLYNLIVICFTYCFGLFLCWGP